MKIKLHPKFKKSFQSRIASNKKLVLKTEERISLFKVDPKNPFLRDHQLTGAKEGLRSFSISGDIRIVYMRVSKDEVILFDIGSHNQIY